MIETMINLWKTVGNFATAFKKDLSSSNRNDVALSTKEEKKIKNIAENIITKYSSKVSGDKDAFIKAIKEEMKSLKEEESYQIAKTLEIMSQEFIKDYTTPEGTQKRAQKPGRN
ncbi:MAG: hypothetical protein ACTSXQ_03270 [Alphaproteobacteria bacterium]